MSSINSLLLCCLCFYSCKKATLEKLLFSVKPVTEKKIQGDLEEDLFCNMIYREKKETGFKVYLDRSGLAL